MPETRTLPTAEPIFPFSQRFASCHASTILELPDQTLLAAWFGGAAEGAPDVAIWLARRAEGEWSQPVRVVAHPGVPLWNPVLFLHPTGSVWLFYKIGPTIPAWTGAYITSDDGGRSWSVPTILPAGLIGPAKNKPIRLSNGDLLCGSSSEAWLSWACWVELSRDQGRTWSRFGPLVAPAPGERDAPPEARTWEGTTYEAVLNPAFRGVIQPTVWEYAPGRLKMLMRSTQAVGRVCSATSEDYGRTWSSVEATTLPHSNTGLDAIRLTDGRVVLLCTPRREGRTPLSLLVSEDNGVTWPWRQDLETGRGEYSYPAVIQGVDGRVHVTYTYRREQIRYVAFTPGDLGAS